MPTDAWTQFVAGFCLAHGLLTGDQVEQLRRSEFYMLARTQFDLGAGPRMVRRLLERAAGQPGRGKHGRKG